MHIHAVSFIVCFTTILFSSAVQNERDRISVRRPSYDDVGQNGVLSVSTLLNAELLSRQVRVAQFTIHGGLLL